MWEFSAALNGYAKAHNPSDGNRLSETEKNDLFDWIERSGNDNRAVRTSSIYGWDGERFALVRSLTFTV